MRTLSQNLVAASLLVVLVGTVLSGVATIQTERNTSIAFVHATVIDGTGANAKPNETIVLSGDRITAVGPSSSVLIPRGARTVEATGRFLIPGLWDAHLHTRFEGIDHPRLLVANGITSARNMSAPWEYLPDILALRDQIAKVDRVGPRFLTAGPVLDGPGARRTTNTVINNPDEGQQAVRRVKRGGADFVKVYNLLSRESFFAIAAEAKVQGLPFVGHLPYTIKAEEASDAGQLSIEHADAIARASSIREDEIRKQLQERLPASVPFVDIAKLKTLADRLKKNRTSVVPTLSNYLKGLSEYSAVANGDRLRYVPAAYSEEWRQAPQPQLSLENRRLLFEQCLIVVRELNKAGVTILAGTDSGTPFQVPGFSLHDELSLLVKAGMSEMEALEAATRNPARTFNLTDQGTIEIGMRADLILLDSSPLENIDNTRKIRMVVARGHVYDRNALDAMLSDIQSSASQWTGTPTR